MACGRVSVGGDLDKRPVNHPRKDRQPEANRRTPPNGGRDLKQRRTGLFWSLSALQRPTTEEACLSCRACGRDQSPPNDGCETRRTASRLPPERSHGAASDRAFHTSRLSSRRRAELTGHGGGSTLTERVSNARPAVVSPPILFTLPGAGDPRDGGCRYD